MDNNKSCWVCNKPANSKHHLVAQTYGGLDYDNNLIDLCRECHDAVDNNRKFLEKPQLELLDNYPRLQLLLMVKLYNDTYFWKTKHSIASQVIFQAIKVLDDPNDKTNLEKLRNAAKALKSKFPTFNLKEREKRSKVVADD